MMVWGSTSYTSLAAFQAASGQESHGLQADPRLDQPVAGRLHAEGRVAGDRLRQLRRTRPAGPGRRRTSPGRRPGDAPTPARARRKYDDRGAYEYQP